MLIVASVIVALLALEVGGRIYRGPAALLDWSNFIVERRLPDSQPSSHLASHPSLGFVLKPDHASALATHDSQGFRVTPSPAAAMLLQPPVLATGNSFAYGLEVADGESWPAYLQALLDRQVVNAGVPGYGLDQIVLRTELLVPEIKPVVTVLSFIPDDIPRTEMSRLWGREKPYFELNGDELAPRNMPLPPDPVPGSRLSTLQRLFGWSILLDIVQARLVADGAEWVGDSERALPRGQGERLGCPLMRRVAAIGAPVLVVAQYDPYVFTQPQRHRDLERRRALTILKCADEAGLATLDLFEATRDLIKARGLTAAYASNTDHHNASGNRFTAEAIAEELKRRGMVPAP